MSELKKLNRDNLSEILEKIAKQIRERAKKWPGGRALTKWDFVDVKLKGDDLGTTMLKFSVYLDAESEIDLCQEAIREIDPEAFNQPPVDFLTKDILYGDGHKCVPNGVGDYDLVCPTLGQKPGFIPFMWAHILDGQRCACGHELRKLE